MLGTFRDWKWVGRAGWLIGLNVFVLKLSVFSRGLNGSDLVDTLVLSICSMIFVLFLKNSSTLLGLFAFGIA